MAAFAKTCTSTSFLVIRDQLSSRNAQLSDAGSAGRTSTGAAALLSAAGMQFSLLASSSQSETSMGGRGMTSNNGRSGRSSSRAATSCCAYKTASENKSKGVESKEQKTSPGSMRGPREGNVPGNFFVDHTCINCDVCRWMAPGSFRQVGDKSAVVNQPETEEEQMKAMQAMLSCPTASIHSQHHPIDIHRVHQTFPLPIHESLPGVFHCGYHSKKSFGAASYFVRRADGNILVDCPRYSEHLARTLQEMGGVKYIFLTHRDDVADHARWAARFKATRVIHAAELDFDTSDAEMVLEGSGPWDLGVDVSILFTPGHTEGSCCMLLKPVGALFSGDHLCFSHATGGLSMNKRVNWFSVPYQVNSVQKLSHEDFTWILPGHGRRFMFDNLEAKTSALLELVRIERNLPN